MALLFLKWQLWHSFKFIHALTAQPSRTKSKCRNCLKWLNIRNIKICVYDIGDPIRHCLGHLRPPLEVLTSRQHLTRSGFRRSLLCVQNKYISGSLPNWQKIAQFWSSNLWKPTRQGLFRGQLVIIWPMTATAPPAAPTPRAGPKNPMPPNVHTCVRLCLLICTFDKCFRLWRIYPAYQRLKLQVQRCRRRWLN